MSALGRFSMPFRFRLVRRLLRDRDFTMLDVGCGYHAPSKTKRYFPRCRYHGLDLAPVELDDADHAAMEAFYPIDLDAGDLSAVPDGTFDLIVMSHVIEHLHHGTRVLGQLAAKLRAGGYLYVEYPGAASLRMPHARRGFLHFCDDPTHRRVYTLAEVANAMLDAGIEIERAGTRRDPYRIAATPLFLLRGALRGDPWGGGIWDAAGICEYALGRARPAPALSGTSREHLV